MAGRSSVPILEADPDLGQDLAAEDLGAATQALVAKRVSLNGKSHGDWGPADPSGHLGLLVVEGLLLREVRLLGTCSAELIGHGDLLRPWDVDGELGLPMPAEIHWTALEPAAVAVLDSHFVRHAFEWPEVLAALTSRTVVRTMSLALNTAVSNLKRIDQRLLLLFWHLAQRWGKMGIDGVALRLPLTHDTLAKLVGAARPSVTTALAGLARDGLLRREDGVWLLSRQAEVALDSERGAGRVAQRIH